MPCDCACSSVRGLADAVPVSTEFVRRRSFNQAACRSAQNRLRLKYHFFADFRVSNWDGRFCFLRPISMWRAYRLRRLPRHISCCSCVLAGLSQPRCSGWRGDHRIEKGTSGTALRASTAFPCPEATPRSPSTVDARRSESNGKIPIDMWT